MFPGLLVAAVALGGGKAAPPAKLYAHTRWPYAGFLGRKDERVIRSAAELAEAAPPKDGESAAAARKRVAADVARALKVKAIDWDRQVLVLIRVPRANPLQPVVVTGVKAEGRTLTVYYTYYVPVAARPQDRPPQPVSVSLVALVSRTGGPVRVQGNRHFPR
jgi:hypothetical protein